MDTFRKIALVGGTHGNELTGVHLAQRWLQDPSQVRQDGLDIQVLLANPEAVRIGRRYVDEDLNRCFSQPQLSATPINNEGRRAQEINAILGPKGSPQAVDLIVDLHNSSASMGVCLIFSRPHPALSAYFARMLQADPETRLYYQPEEPLSCSYLPSVGKYDVTIEVGAQPHGTLVADLYFRAQKASHLLLDHLVAWNSGKRTEPAALPIYEQFRDIDYPRHPDGRIAAMVHPDLQGRDFQPVPPGSPMFLGFDGTVYPWAGPETVYPIFINEQAYYEKGIAMSLTLRKEMRW